MSLRSLNSRGALTGSAALALLALALGTSAAVAPAHRGEHTPWAATSQEDCAFRLPKPSIESGQANFTVSASCAASKERRKLDVELVADDPSYDDTLHTASRSISMGKGTHSFAGRRWNCHEDATGRDEVYLRVRIEAYRSNAWHKAKWVDGSAASGDCH